MREPGWASVLRRLLEAETAAAARFASLATLTVNGRPSVRTVVFRGLYEGTRGDAPMLQVATDARSAKVDGLRRCNWAELCWYFTVRVCAVIQALTTHADSENVEHRKRVNSSASPDT